MKDVIELFAKVDGRDEWDSNMSECEVLKEYNDNVLLKRYIMIIPIPFMQNREFVEKQVIFSSYDSVYVYSTSVNDTLEPLRSGVTRAKSIICGSRISKVGNSIVINIVSQLDMKMCIPSVLLGGKMADGMIKFKQDFIKKLDSMNDA